MLPGAPARRRSLDRRDRPHDPLQRARAVARGRARGHRLGVVAQRVDLAAERRAGQHSRATASRSPARCRGRRRRPPAKLPAVVLVGGSGPTDRDGLRLGIPILGQLAGALADAGFIVVRYDKRGIGQSGGRAESASLTDYAEDVRAAVKMLADRKDVDPKRIAVVGHSEGGSVALMAAAKDKRIARRRPARDARASPAPRSCSRSSSACSNRIEADGRGEAGEGRRAEEDSRGGDHRQGAGAAAA